jgi:hypothetical protein
MIAFVLPFVPQHPYITGGIIGLVWAFRPHLKVSCPTCGTRHSRAPYAVGALTAFGAGSYYGARRARDLHALMTGRIGPRIANKIIGRTIVRRMWFR